jgi:hypothetical protein
METQSLPTSAAALIKRLNAPEIRERLDSLERERKALLVLLRAALRAQQDDRLHRKD